MDANNTNSPTQILGQLLERYPALHKISGEIGAAFEILKTTYQNGGKVLCCGNGGSCADSDHIVGELMKSFLFKRKIRSETEEKLIAMGDTGREIASGLEGALPAVSLCAHNALTTAYLNDTNPYLTFAQQLYGIGKSGDTLIALTTSGNSKNCVYAAAAARVMDISVIAFTGGVGGKIAAYSDVVIRVPEKETFMVQEYHLPVYHCLCAMLEAEFFERH